jgi:hypothetical protein
VPDKACQLEAKCTPRVTTAEENATAKQQWAPHAAMPFTDFFILFNNDCSYKNSQIMTL